MRQIVLNISGAARAYGRLRGHEKINFQFWQLRRPTGKARKLKEYQAYFEFS